MSEKDINELENKEEQTELEKAETEKPYQVVIEDARKELFKSYSLTRRISNILMFVVVAAIVGIMFMIISNNNVLKIVGYCLAGALLVGMIVYYLLSRKKFPNKTKEYVELVCDSLNKRAFSKQGFEQIQNDKEEKLQLDDLVGDGIYAEATGINSRNVVHGVYKGHHFLYAEAALLRPT